MSLGRLRFIKSDLSANRWKDYTWTCRFLAKENTKLKERKKHRSKRIAEYRMTIKNDVKNNIVLRNDWVFESSLNGTKATRVLHSKTNQITVFARTRKNSRHFATPARVSPRNNVWETSAEIPYWWRANTQIWVVVEANFPCGTTNQKSYLGSDTSSVWNFCARRHFAGKPEVASRSQAFILCFFPACYHSRSYENRYTTFSSLYLRLTGEWLNEEHLARLYSTKWSASTDK